MEYAKKYATSHRMTTRDAMKDPKVKKLYDKDKEIKNSKIKKK